MKLPINPFSFLGMLFALCLDTTVFGIQKEVKNQSIPKLWPDTVVIYKGSQRKMWLTSELVKIAKSKSVDMRKVRKLVNSGADIHKYFTYVLIRPTTKVKYDTKIQYSALQWAAIRGHWKMVDYLIDHGAGVNPVTSAGIEDDYSTPLENATHQSLYFVKKMVKHGADVNSTLNSHGETALISAAYRGKIDIIKYLISKGAKVNIYTDNHYTALDWAICGGNKPTKSKVINLLHRNHAKLYSEILHN